MPLVVDDPENLDADGAPARRGPRLGPRVGSWTVVGLVALVAVIGWWWWPSLSGQDDELDVLVAGDRFVTDATRSFDLRVREEGWSIGWSDTTSSSRVSSRVSSWCDDPAALREEIERRDPQRVVLSFADGADQAACVDAFLDGITAGDGPSVVVVAQPGVGPDPVATDRRGVAVADPTRLVPDGMSTMSCAWWEDCETGTTTVRGADGALTEEGGERLARVVVAALRG